MATATEILRWVTGTVLDRAPDRGEALTETDLLVGLPECPDTAQAKSREAAEAMSLIGPESTMPEVPAELWRWMAFGNPEARAREEADAHEESRKAVEARQVPRHFDPGNMIENLLARIAQLGFAVDNGGPFMFTIHGVHDALLGVHDALLDMPVAARPQHPLAPIVAACLERPRTPQKTTVTAAVGLTRRPELVSTVRRLTWADHESVEAAHVDGEPIAARLPALIPDMPKCIRARKRRIFQPADELRLPGVPPVPVSLRMAALEGLPPAMAGDVLTLMTLAHAVNPPGLRLTDREGAALLSRTRDGGFRRPKDSDIERYREALAMLPAAVWFLDDCGLWDWREIAIVETFPDGTRNIRPPAWVHGANNMGGRWTLTAEGGAAARSRIVAGEGGAAGRLITGIEYRLGARFDGRPGIAPDLRPASGKTGPAAHVHLPWREVMRLAGDAWEPGPREDEAARSRFNRAMDRLEAAGYLLPGPGVRGEAPAGDSVEIVERVRGSRSRPARLGVRASARMVEAARLASLRDGGGFGTVRLEDWLGERIRTDDPGRPKNRNRPYGNRE